MDNDASSEVPFEHTLREWLAATPLFFTLSTCVNNVPNARIVAFRGIRKHESQLFIQMFGNCTGKKHRELEANNHVAATFYLPPTDTTQQRQLRITGIAHLAPKETQQVAWKGLPNDIKKREWSYSKLSQIIEPGQEKTPLPDNYTEKPQHWGVTWIRIDQLEFWQGSSTNLEHNIQRILWCKSNAGWKKSFLAP